MKFHEVQLVASNLIDRMIEGNSIVDRGVIYYSTNKHQSDNGVFLTDVRILFMWDNVHDEAQLVQMKHRFVQSSYSEDHPNSIEARFIRSLKQLNIDSPFCGGDNKYYTLVNGELIPSEPPPARRYLNHGGRPR